MKLQEKCYSYQKRLFRQKFSFGEINLRFYLFKALVGVDVVEPGELVGVEDEGGGVEDELGGGPGQLLHLPVGEVEGVRVPLHPRLHRAHSNTLLLRHLSHLK